MTIVFSATAPSVLTPGTVENRGRSRQSSGGTEGAYTSALTTLLSPTPVDHVPLFTCKNIGLEPGWLESLGSYPRFLHLTGRTGLSKE